jgi:hypothetical protein
MRTESKAADKQRLAPILAGVKDLLRGQASVELPREGIDLLFEEGVVARCRVCELAWAVRNSQFSSPAWWACPRGCQPPV